MVDSWIYNYIDKKLVKTDIAEGKTLDEAAIILPEGVYTTIRTYEKKYVLHLKLHLERIIEGFEISNFPFVYDVNEIRSAITAILNQNTFDLRIRIHIPFVYPENCYIFTEDLPQYPEHYYKNGVNIKTNHLERDNPKAKLTKFIHKSLKEKTLIKSRGFEESIIVDKSSDLLEGLSSNFFGIKDYCLMTAEHHVLHGITRKIVLELAEELGVKILYTPVKANEIDQLSEAFITSTSRNIMPVRQINDDVIGESAPGPITLKLMERIEKRIQSETEVITI